MTYLRNITVSDTDEIVKIHLKAFPDFFLTSLGYSFLKTYYKSCAKSNEAISICAINDEGIMTGFAVGCLNSKGFNKQLILSNFYEFFYRTIFILITNPRGLIRLIKNLTKRNVKEDFGDYAELYSIGVLPNQRGYGVGQRLLSNFEEKVRSEGGEIITLTTDANFNDKVLDSYRKSGYSVYYEFVTFPNRRMLKLIKTLSI